MNSVKRVLGKIRGNPESSKTSCSILKSTPFIQADILSVEGGADLLAAAGFKTVGDDKLSMVELDSHGKVVKKGAEFGRIALVVRCCDDLLDTAKYAVASSEVASPASRQAAAKKSMFDARRASKEENAKAIEAQQQQEQAAKTDNARRVRAENIVQKINVHEQREKAEAETYLIEKGKNALLNQARGSAPPSPLDRGPPGLAGSPKSPYGRGR